MNNRNQTDLRNCRFLGDEYFHQLFEAFNEAFSDYVVPFALTEVQFRNHINLTAVDLNRTIGCLDKDDKLAGFSLNGFGDWNGLPTVYDAGTGVIPDQRRQGLSEAMFEVMIPVFKEQRIEQFLLEVVTTNIGAVKLYEKLDFMTTRTLALLQCDQPVNALADTSETFDIRDITEPDWELLRTFWDGQPSWQNSVDAVKRSIHLKRFIGAFEDGVCVGYIVFSSKVGRVAQIAVSKEHRGRGIGTALVRAMQSETSDGFSLQIINIDKSLSDVMDFFRNRGFYERLAQFEMVKTM